MDWLRSRKTLKAVSVVVVAFVTGSGLPVSALEEEEGHHHTPIPQEQRHEFGLQKVALEGLPGEGWVLAIGGGGESVIGQLEGSRVVAIDISARELRDAPGDALKVVMDARDLQFLDDTFETAASFFTFMYIKRQDQAKVMAEVYRVLAPGGRLLIWDVVFGPRPNEDVRMGVVFLEVQLPGKQIETGYGVGWPEEPKDLPHYQRIARAAGFDVAEARVQDQWFYLELVKPRLD